MNLLLSQCRQRPNYSLNLKGAGSMYIITFRSTNAQNPSGVLETVYHFSIPLSVYIQTEVKRVALDEAPMAHLAANVPADRALR